MTPAPNINRHDVDRFVADLWRDGVELYMWAELWPAWKRWYENPDCRVDGCLICGDDWIWDRGAS